MGNNRVQDPGAWEQLRPCPFCGGEANIYQMHFWGTTYTCECSNCGIETKPMDTEAEAIEAWNRRAERTVKPKKGAYDLIRCDCGMPVSSNYDFCPKCKAKLDWSE